MALDGPLRTRPALRTLLAAAALAATACAHWPGARGKADAEARAAIAAANAEYGRALVAGDARAAAAVYAPDGVVIPTAQRGFITGRAEIEAYNASRLEARRYVDVVITTVQLEVSGDLAWESGTSSVTVQQGEKATATLTGRYLAVWRREPDGRWRIRADLPITDPVP
ncbi:MAG TPA: SgcJ/EcaC family oxidoreductase [Anaeromyxobacteraceae bacterium]|nr:SgcJ/EcaC family oxidoreductase [Anaeromyxobacteraceae bacterium]